MRATSILIGLLFISSTLGDEDAVKKEMALLEGEFSMVSGEASGQQLPDDMLKSAKRIAKKGETTVMIGGEVYIKAKFKVDPTKKPKAIDYEMTEGPTKGKTHLGIYKIEDDKIEFCFASPDKPRPTEFSAKEGSGNTYSVWKREKK